jgi:hypothetical protein
VLTITFGKPIGKARIAAVQIAVPFFQNPSQPGARANPSAGDYVAMAGVGEDAATLEYEPATHELQFIATAVDAEKKPTPHAKHALEAAAVVKVPAAHAEQVNAPPEE